MYDAKFRRQTNHCYGKEAQCIPNEGHSQDFKHSSHLYRSYKYYCKASGRSKYDSIPKPGTTDDRYYYLGTSIIYVVPVFLPYTSLYKLRSFKTGIVYAQQCQ